MRLAWLYALSVALAVYGAFEGLAQALLTLVYALLVSPFLMLLLVAARAPDGDHDVQMLKEYYSTVNRVSWETAQAWFKNAFLRIFCRGRWTLKRKDGTFRFLEGDNVEARARALFEGSNDWLFVMDDCGEVVLHRNDEAMETLQRGGAPSESEK